MNRLAMLLAASALALGAGAGARAGQEAARDRGEGSRQSLLRGDQPGLREVELRERGLRVHLLLHRPGVDVGRGRRGADRAGHARPARHRRDRDLAVERQADRPDDPHRGPVDAGDDRRRRPGRRGRRPAQDLSRHRQLPDGQAHRRVHRREEARRRHGLHDPGQPGRRQHPAPRPGRARRALRPGGPHRPQGRGRAGPRSRAARSSPTTTAPSASRR